MKPTLLAASTLGAAALVLGVAGPASAATVPASASAVQPAVTWHYYGTYTSLAKCNATAASLEAELKSEGTTAVFQCRGEVGGAYVYFALWIGI
jgi:hypothetical protein